MAVDPLGRARRQDNHTVTALPTKRFLKAESPDIELFPGDIHSKTGRGGIGNCQTGAVVRDPVAIGDTNPGGSAIPGENDIIVEIDSHKSGRWP